MKLVEITGHLNNKIPRHYVPWNDIKVVSLNAVFVIKNVVLFTILSDREESKIPRHYVPWNDNKIVIPSECEGSYDLYSKLMKSLANFNTFS